MIKLHIEHVNYKSFNAVYKTRAPQSRNGSIPVAPEEDDSAFWRRDRSCTWRTWGLWSLEAPLSVDIVSELLPLSAFSRNDFFSFFLPPETESFPLTNGRDKLLAPKPLSLLPKLKKLSCGSGPERVFILFSPKDDATIGDTDKEVGPEDGGGGGAASSDFFNCEGEEDELDVSLLKLGESLPFNDSFFFRRLFAALLGVVAAEAAGELSLEREGDKDLVFFLSDRIGELELEPKDRGLLDDPSGLEVSDFLEEKNLPLNTIEANRRELWWGINK